MGGKVTTQLSRHVLPQTQETDLPSVSAGVVSSSPRCQNITSVDNCTTTTTMPFVFYDGLGFDAIPLEPGTKVCKKSGWQSKPVERLWRGVNSGVNVGLRAGGTAKLAFIDCDNKTNPETFNNVTAFMSYNLGLHPGDYPIVETASGVGKHIYISFSGNWDGHSVNLSHSIGAGEFRYGSGAYVVAAPSIVDGKQYSLFMGDYAWLPTLDAKDIARIVGTIPPDKTGNPQSFQDERIRTLSRRAIQLLTGGWIGYDSRSQAEQALIDSLVSAGKTFEEILDLFLSNPCAGKFHERYVKNPTHGITYLKGSYDKAVSYTAKDGLYRQQAAECFDWSNSISWTGRTGSTDKLVYQAHTFIAHRCGRKVYGASTRELAELSGIDRKTATRANSRLCKQHLVKRVENATVDSPIRYELLSRNVPNSFNTVTKWCTHATELSTHDIFRRVGLGKAACECYQTLLNYGPQTIKELCNATGRNRGTIWRVLKKMSKIIDSHTGEVLSLVECEGEKWAAVEGVNLDLVAACLGTAGMGRKQHEQHLEDRRRHRRELLRSNKNDKR
jgi:hypothetical protein